MKRYKAPNKKMKTASREDWTSWLQHTLDEVTEAHALSLDAESDRKRLVELLGWRIYNRHRAGVERVTRELRRQRAQGNP